ncbi:MAG TPA: TetR/AcrR family transcriptional regulator C-terminal domain-containing protein [Actinomycetota bacterium]|nr:TetR/AcrR family transcriptional regulator C-terminal domain-containing protein [Actinomycetota bacterium]
MTTDVSRKAHREPLTRERIVETALRVMDAEGLEAVTMRRIGRELGVEAMSLYNHVEDKESILDGICELVMSEFEFPDPAEDWAESCRRAARAWRQLLKQHPDVMRLFAEARGPVRSVDSMRPTEFALRLLRASGLSDRDTAQAFHAFGGYIQGFVIMEMGSIAGGTDEAQLKVHEELAAALPEEFSTLRDVSPYFAECGADEQFEFGLDLLIRGVLERVRAQPA